MTKKPVAKQMSNKGAAKQNVVTKKSVAKPSISKKEATAPKSAPLSKPQVKDDSYFRELPAKPVEKEASEPKWRLTPEDEKRINERVVDPKLLDQVIEQTRRVRENAEEMELEDILPSADALQAAASNMKTNMEARSARIRMEAETRAASDAKAKQRNEEESHKEKERRGK